MDTLHLLAQGILTAASLLNLGANLWCLRLLTPFRSGDLNMASAWECSRNDVFEGGAVVLTAAGVWALDSGWPDVVVASVLLVMFLRSAGRVLTSAMRTLRDGGTHGIAPNTR